MNLVEQRLNFTPPNWDRRRIKHHLSRIIGGGTPSKDREEYWTDGTIPWVSPKDMKRRWIDNAEDLITETAVCGSATSIILPGSVLVVVRSGILKHSLPVAINLVPVALNQDMKALLFRHTLFPQFFAYWIEGQTRSLLLEWGQIGATVDNINVDAMLNAWIALPDPEAQKAIADFLDRETARIDQLIEKKQQLVDLINEKWSATLTRLTMRGLGSYTTRPSGTPWIGEVPKHWTVSRLRYLLAYEASAIKPGPFGSDLRSDEMNGDYATVLNQRAVIDRDFGRVNPAVSKAKYESLLSFSVRPGDILITSRGTIGRATVVPDDIGPTIIHPCVIRIRLDTSVLLPKYFLHLLEESAFLRQVLDLSNATTIDVIYGNVLREVSFAVPPKEEQHQIDQELRLLQERYTRLFASTRESIDRLLEFRAALSTAAVTGQIDVTSWGRRGETDRRLDRIEEAMRA